MAKRWRGPEYEGEFPSLGWGVLDLAPYCVAPSGLHRGSPLTPVMRQVRFIVNLYRIDPVTGKGVYRRAVDEGAKGVGKSPMGCLIGLGELVGPVVFDGWDANGEPVGRPHPSPWIQVCATAEDQTENLYGAFRNMLGDSPAIDEFRIDLGKTRIELIDRPGKMEPVTTAAGTREGTPLSCALNEETQYWTERNGGWQTYDTQQRNVSKMGGRSVSFTNAPLLGFGSVAERDMLAAEKGTAGLLYQAHRGPHVEDLTDRDILLPALAEAYAADPENVEAGAVPWVDLERLADECADPAVRSGAARRFYLNIPDQDTEASWIEPEQWTTLADPELVIPDGVDVFLGIDVALYHDNTAVAVVHRQDDGRFAVTVRVWEPGAAGEIDVTDVMAHIRELSMRYRIKEACYDPRFFDVPAKMLADEGVPMVEIPQSSTVMIPACGYTFEQIVAKNLVHTGDPILERHVLGAAVRTGEAGWTLSKNKSRDKIDACIAMVLGVFRAGQHEQRIPEFAGAWL